MTLKFDDRFTDHPKWAPLSDGAFRLAMEAIAWSSRPERKRKGFVPDAMLVKLAHKSRAVALKLAKELVDTGKPDHEHGILEVVEGGWQVHDLGDFRPWSPDVSSKRSEAGRKGAANRWQTGPPGDGKLPSGSMAKRWQVAMPTDGKPIANGWQSDSPARVSQTGSQSSGEENPKDLSGFTRETTGVFSSSRKCEESFGSGPGDRQEVQRVFEIFKQVFGFTEAKFRGPFDLQAKVIAEAIDAHGEEACSLVARHAPNDGMVSGRTDERKQEHHSVSYIFGNEQTFQRILRDARRQDEKKTGSVSDLVARLKGRKAEGA
jgi:hypothetical protein